MGKFCVLKACRNRDLTKTQNTALKRHIFPTDSAIKRLWENFVNINNKTTNFRANTRSVFICSEHFTRDCFELFSGRLTRGSVPSIAPRYTAECALKCGLIPSLDSELLEQLNNDICESERMQCSNIRGEDCTGSALSSGLLAAHCAPEPSFQPVSLSSESIKIESTSMGDLAWDSLDQAHQKSLPTTTSKQELSEAAQRGNPSQGIEVVLISSNLTCNSESVWEALRTKRRETLGEVSLTLFNEENNDPANEPVPSTSIQESVLFTTPHAKRRAYVGDLSPDDFSSPYRSQKALNVVKDTVKSVRHRLKVTQQKLRRAQKKIKNLESLLSHLKKERLVSDDTAQVMELNNPLKWGVNAALMWLCVQGYVLCT